MRHHLALLLALPLTGCIRGCDFGTPPSPGLTVAGTASQTLTVKHASTKPDGSWSVALVAAEPGSVAPTLAPHPTLPDHYLARWTSPDGAHETELIPLDGCLMHDGGALHFPEANPGGLLLLPWGKVIPFAQGPPPPVTRTTWGGRVGETALAVIAFGAGGKHAHVVLHDGAPLSAAALGGRLDTSVTFGAAGLLLLKVGSPRLSFELQFPDRPADRVDATAQVDGRDTPLVLRREGQPGP